MPDGVRVDDRQRSRASASFTEMDEKAFSSLPVQNSESRKRSTPPISRFCSLFAGFCESDNKRVTWRLGWINGMVGSVARTRCLFDELPQFSLDEGLRKIVDRYEALSEF